MNKIFSTLCLVCIVYHASAVADTALVTYILKRIEKLQVKNDPFFIRGSFPAYIDHYHQGYSERHKDNNTSFCIVINTLESVRDKLTPSQCTILDSIHQRTIPVVRYFANKQGRGTYNFWRQDTIPPFPYMNWIPLLVGNSWMLPDDFDDTVWCLELLGADSLQAAKIHAIMQHFSGYPPKKVIGCPVSYKSIPAYSTWFGKNFPVFFDICVSTNILRFVQLQHLQWTKADSATLQFLVTAIQSGDYMKRYIELSPYYENKAVIIYHLARLMTVRSIPALDSLKEKILTDAVHLFGKSHNLLEEMLLSSAIQKLGYRAPELVLTSNLEQLIAATEQNDLAFFAGDVIGYFEGTLRNALTILFKKSLTFYHYCPAYNDALLIEFLLLNQSSYGS